MAFTTGVHVECSFGGSKTAAMVAQTANFPVEGELVWSETMPFPGTTTQSAPPQSSIQGYPLISIEATVDIFVAIGKTPNALSGPRMLVRAGMSRQRYVSEGDRLAWVEA